jgi:DNA-binding SARP family transcriptional activator
VSTLVDDLGLEIMMNPENFPRFRLLGSPRVEYDGQNLDLGGDRDQRMLIVLLAARSEPVPREALMRWIWDEPGHSAVAMHHELMGRLRARLTTWGLPGALVAEHGTCRLQVPDGAVDLHCFRRLVSDARAGDDQRAASLLRQALELFDGEPFGALCGERVENFRTTLLDERMSARIEYAEVSLRLGRETQILPELAELNRTEPFHEKVAGLLMRAHYQNNDSSRAGAVFQHIRKQLSENLGAEIGKELAELNQRIIQRDPALLPARKENRTEQIGATMTDTDEPDRNRTNVHTTGMKLSFGSGSYAAENAVIGGTNSVLSAPPGTDAKEVNTGDKVAGDGGKAFENVIVNGFPE